MDLHFSLAIQKLLRIRISKAFASSCCGSLLVLPRTSKEDELVTPFFAFLWGGRGIDGPLLLPVATPLCLLECFFVLPPSRAIKRTNRKNLCQQTAAAPCSLLQEFETHTAAHNGNNRDPHHFHFHSSWRLGRQRTTTEEHL